MTPKGLAARRTCASTYRRAVYERFATGRCGHRPLRGAFRSGRTRRVTKYDSQGTSYASLIGHSPRSPPRRPCTRVGAAIGRPRSTQLFPHHPGRIRTIHPGTDLHRRCGIAGLYRGRAMQNSPVDCSVFYSPVAAALPPELGSTAIAPTHRYAPECAKCGGSRASWPKAASYDRRSCFTALSRRFTGCPTRGWRSTAGSARPGWGRARRRRADRGWAFCQP